MKLVTTEEMRRAEIAAVEAGDTWPALMDRAGRAVADEVLARVKLLHGKRVRRVVVLVGPGNNGGDALVAARCLCEAGARVTCYLWERREWAGDPLVQGVSERGGQILQAEEDERRQSLREQLRQSDAVVDGLLGLGLTRALDGAVHEIVASVNAAARPLVVAIDLPTGVHADTGEILGVGLQATCTVTMGRPKRGLYQFPGAGYAGEVIVANIGIPDKFLAGVRVELVDAERVRAVLPSRPPDAHKGTFGRALVIAGSLHYTGAALLAAMAAYRVGAGLVTVAPPRTIYPFLAAQSLEPTFVPLPESESGAIGEDAVKVLAGVIGRYEAVVLGCGIGQDAGTVAFVRRFLHMHERAHAGIGFVPRAELDISWELPPTVLDADALTVLAGVAEWWRWLPPGRVVLTPHAGEMARLLGVTPVEVMAARIAVTQRAAATWGQVVVFKGAHTVIAEPDGTTLVNPGATPALATAGTGDVLAGVIGGLLAQGLSPFDAAVAGVHVHGLAGRLLQDEVGDTGGLAGGVLAHLAAALRRCR